MPPNLSLHPTRYSQLRWPPRAGALIEEAFTFYPSCLIFTHETPAQPGTKNQGDLTS